MTIKDLKKIFKKLSLAAAWDGDNAVLGLQILSKYFDPKSKTLITGADHDIIFSVNIKEALDRGLTEEDAKELARLNWMLEDDEYFSCFV